MAVGKTKGAQAALIRAGAAADRGDFSACRSHWNTAFAAAGLEAPLDTVDRPVTLDDFHSTSRSSQGNGGPLVSVVVPYRDAADTLAVAVGSMLGQSWSAVEILLVDDRSADKGPALASKLAAGDRRIRLLKNERGPGVYGARNTAVAAAKGDFVTFMDADDWSPPERLARQLAAIDHRYAAAIANHVRIDENGRPFAPRIFPLLRPTPITMMVRRETLDHVGPFEERATGADSELLGRLEMIHGKESVTRDTAPLLVSSWHSTSLSVAREGGLFGRERYEYRAEWMHRHAGVARRLPASPSPS